MRKSLKGIYGVKKDQYWGLPKELEEFNYYFDDGEIGHVIMAIPESELGRIEKNDDLDMWECPFPVRYVLEKGYRIYKNHIVCDGKYDRFLGLQIEQKYYETYWEPNTENKRKDCFSAFHVGQIISKFKGLKEGVRFSMSDSGAMMIICFNSPTIEEIAQFHSSSPFEIRFVNLSNIIMLTVKIGNLEWMDTPYSVHLNRNLTYMPVIDDGHGLNLTLMLVDVNNGEIKHIRLLGLSTDFSVALCKEIDKQKEKHFDSMSYDFELMKVFDDYSTERLVQISNNCCKIN